MSPFYRCSSLLLVAFAARTATAQLQVYSLPPARIGLIGGMNRATFDSDAPGLTNRSAFVGGISYINPLSIHRSFQLDILYSMKGAKSEDATSDATATLKFNYISMPVMLRTEFPTTSRARAFLHGGAAFDYRIGCGGEATFGGQKATTSCDELKEGLAPGSSFNRFDWGPVLGGGVALDVGSRTLSLGVRYELGMRDLVSDGEHLKNRTLSFVASLEAPLPRK
jgi:hypothetical protein